MQTSLKEKTNFFEKISQIIDYYGIKSVNDFAVNYLNYKSAEKINRLKKENTNPSFEILSDITNKFENINANWLLGKDDNMIISIKYKEDEIFNEEENMVKEDHVNYKSQNINEMTNDIQLLKSMISKLINDVNRLESRINEISDQSKQVS